MKPLMAISLTIVLAVIGTLIRFQTGGYYISLINLVVLGTAIWAAIDSSKIQLKRYQSGIAYGPVAIFFLFLLLWIVAFPWYLIMRDKIKNGTAVLKVEPITTTT